MARSTLSARTSIPRDVDTPWLLGIPTVNRLSHRPSCPRQVRRPTCPGRCHITCASSRSRSHSTERAALSSASRSSWSMSRSRLRNSSRFRIPRVCSPLGKTLRCCSISPNPRHCRRHMQWPRLGAVRHLSRQSRHRPPWPFASVWVVTTTRSRCSGRRDLSAAGRGDS